MSQGPLCPNLTKNFQKEVSPNCQSKFLMCYAIRWFKCKLKPPKNEHTNVRSINISTSDMYLTKDFLYACFFNAVVPFDNVQWCCREGTRTV